jgi:gliding motility-associated-like protein
MSKPDPNIDRLYKQRFEGWEAPYEPGEAGDVFSKVQQQLPQSGSGSGTGGDGGASAAGSGAKGLLGGMQGWFLSGIAAVILTTGAGYFLMTGDPDNTSATSTAPDPVADSSTSEPTAKMPGLEPDAPGPLPADNPETPRETKPEPKPGSNAPETVPEQSTGKQERPDSESRTSANGTDKAQSDGRKLSTAASGDDKPAKTANTTTRAAESRAEGSSSTEKPALMVMDTALCPYERVRFSVQGIAETEQAEYRLGQSAYQPVRPGRQAVSLPAGEEQQLLLVVRTKQNPTTADTQAIQVLPRPKAAFALEPLEPHRYQFSDQSQQATNQQWRLGNGSKQRQATFRHTYQKGGTKRVQLIASAASGCMDTAEQQFVVEDVPDVELPNIFTPNDDGRNDRLHIGHGDLDAFELRIKNGRGTVVFETTDPGRTWNGKVNNSGPSCNEGVYRYVLRYRYPFHTEMQQKSGKLLLKRRSFK